MNPRLAADLAALPELLESTQRYAADVLDGLDDRPAAHPPTPRTAEPLPAEGAGLAGALTTFARRWAPGLSGSAGPRYLGFVTGGTTPAALAGDWLTSVFDQNASSEIGSAASALEHETLHWLRELFGLPARHSGAFLTGATMSNLVGLAIGREWLGDQLGVDVGRQGVHALGPVEVLSGSPHSSIYKALSMLGLGREAVRQLPVLPDREAVDVAALRAELAARRGRPAIVVANAGTVNTVDYDDLRAIAALREEFPFWLHVDAAFGAFAALSPTYAPLLDGLVEADSVCVDLHKWLNVPYDSAVQFTRRPDLQARVFGNAAAYLGPITEQPDFVHLTPENSRRLRALAAWFSLAAYGRAGHRDIVERNVASAQRVGARLAELPGVRLLAPVRLNVVCLAVPDDPDTVVRALTETGEAFATPTVYAGTPGLRLAFSNWRTTEADEERIVAAVRKALS
ncbi:pyridoxal-dependent decarboxylase [Actinoplanes sp. NPDC051346]|uniref:pyridoxal phosphate-dependent decarboxylase family protein n=1 Tax=Actinoplanes sp. NPDC051346 TaxID=3155048 RepID=UPI0034191D70